MYEILRQFTEIGMIRQANESFSQSVARIVASVGEVKVGLGWVTHTERTFCLPLD